jgi:hypothetical protein
MELKFDLRASCSQNRCSTTWATPPTHFAHVILEMGSWELFFQAGLNHESPDLGLPSGYYYRHESLAARLILLLMVHKKTRKVSFCSLVLVLSVSCIFTPGPDYLLLQGWKEEGSHFSHSHCFPRIATFWMWCLGASQLNGCVNKRLLDHFKVSFKFSSS